MASPIEEFTAVKAVSEYEEMNPTCRNTMEDAHVVMDAFGGVESQALFGVFDGHGGRGVVDYLSKHFAPNFLRELEHEEGSRDVEECFTSAYLITDIQTSRQGLSVSGSTAVTCLIREEEGRRVLYTANVGDSRAVLSRRSGQAERLSFDHKASDPSEIKRIEDAKGFILRKRVMGILSVTRSFGDHAMKKWVIARPYTSRVVLSEEDKMLVLACDGVWDVLTDQECVDLLHDAIESKNLSTDSLAEYLVSEAIERGSTDNVTALVIML